MSTATRPLRRPPWPLDSEEPADLDLSASELFEIQEAMQLEHPWQRYIYLGQRGWRSREIGAVFQVSGSTVRSAWRDAGWQAEGHRRSPPKQRWAVHHHIAADPSLLDENYHQIGAHVGVSGFAASNAVRERRVPIDPYDEKLNPQGTEYVADVIRECARRMRWRVKRESR